MTDEKMAEDSFACKKVLYKATADRRSYIDGFLAGLQAGKDINDITRWHKVVDGDYPPIENDYCSVNILTDKCDIAYYVYNYNRWCVEPSGEVIDPPIAWCEIPEYTEN